MKSARKLWMVKQSNGDYTVYITKPARSVYAYGKKKVYWWQGDSVFSFRPRAFKSIFPELREIDLKKGKLYTFKPVVHISEEV